MKKYKLIINKAARRGKTRSTILRTIQAFRKKGVLFDVEYTKGPRDAGRIAKEALGDFDVIIAVGGDGTVNEVVQGMVHTDKPLGIIPAGTGNDLIKSLGIPKRISKAIDVIFRGKTNVIDLGRMNETYFANGLGIGLDATVNMETRNVKHCKWGLALYFMAFLRTVRTYSSVHLKIRMNGKTLDRDALLLSVGNGTTVGGGFRLTPHAKLDDGLLDITIIDPLPLSALFWHLPKVFTGGICKTRFTTTATTDHVLVESSQALPIHIDGEAAYLDEKTYSIAVIPRALTVIGNF